MSFFVLQSQILQLHECSSLGNRESLPVVCAVSSTARPVNLEVLRRRQWDVSDGAIQTIIMGNVRCLDNKMDKLGEKIEPQRQHRE